MLLSGDLADRLGGEWLEELARRDGATPLTEWSEFMDAFLSRVGVAEREVEPAQTDALRRGARIALRGRGAMDDGLSTTSWRWPGGAGQGERGDVPGGDVDSLRCLSDWARSAAPGPAPGWPPRACVDWAMGGDVLFGGEGDLDEGEAMSSSCRSSGGGARGPRCSSDKAGLLAIRPLLLVSLVK